MSGHLYTFHSCDDRNEWIHRHIISKRTDKTIVLCGYDSGYLFNEYDPDFIPPAFLESIQWRAHGKYDGRGDGFRTVRISISSAKLWEFGGETFRQKDGRALYFDETAAREVFDRTHVRLFAREVSQQ